MGHTLAHGLGGNNQADKYTVEQLRTNIHRNNPCMPAYHTIPCHTIVYHTMQLHVYTYTYIRSSVWGYRGFGINIRGGERRRASSE